MPDGSLAGRRAAVSAVAASIAVLGLACWAISPRFSITGPSLIDDWNALLSAPASMHALVRLHYPAGQRFFPTWILWNWIQWRVPGAPGNMLGPNLLDVARVALLVGGLTLLAWLVVPFRGRSRAEQAILYALPALIVVTVPAFDQDLARFGPQEPALVGALALGGSLLYLGARRLVRHGRADVRSSALVFVGFVFWYYGVFQKETSVCLLVPAALALPFLRARRRELQTRQAALGAAVVVVALLPIFVVLYEVVQIVRRGELVYGTNVKAGGGAVSVFVHAFRVMYPSTQTVIGFVLLGIAVAGLAVTLSQRRIDWIQIALVLLALASLEMSVQTNVYESRYYMPTLALLALAAARAVAELPLQLVRVVAAGAVVFAVASAFRGHSIVDQWAQNDQAGDNLVAAVKQQTHDGCRLTIDGVDDERTHSITALVRYPTGPTTCVGTDRYILLGAAATASPSDACAPARSVPAGEWPLLRMVLVHCAPGT